MIELPNEQQLFYSQTGELWIASTSGDKWPEEKCAGWIRKHLTWGEFQAIVNPAPTKEQIESDFAQSENSWVLEQMPIISMNINYHLDFDDRSISTESAWREYRAKLRNYVKDGKVTAETRPSQPK